MERNTLFDNMMKKLDDYPELKQILKDILLSGKDSSYNPDEKYIQIAAMFNYIVNKNGKIAVACRIMETRLYNLFLSEEETFQITARRLSPQLLLQQDKEVRPAAACGAEGTHAGRGDSVHESAFVGL